MDSPSGKYCIIFIAKEGGNCLKLAIVWEKAIDEEEDKEKQKETEKQGRVEENWTSSSAHLHDVET